MLFEVVSVEEKQAAREARLESAPLSASQPKLGVRCGPGRRLSWNASVHPNQLWFPHLTNAITQGTDACLAALAAGDHGRAGVLARTVKDLAQACREQGESARVILGKALQEAEQSGDPELRAAKEFIKSRRLAKQAVVANVKSQQLLEKKDEDI